MNSEATATGTWVIPTWYTVLATVFALLIVLAGLTACVAACSKRLRTTAFFRWAFLTVNGLPLVWLGFVLLTPWRNWWWVAEAIVVAGFLAWTVRNLRPGVRQVYLLISLGLLLLAWGYYHKISLFSEIPWILTHPTAVAAQPRLLLALFGPLAPIVTCLVLLVYELTIRRGAFEHTVITRPSRRRAQRLCPHCGAAADTDAVFCTGCGQRIGA